MWPRNKLYVLLQRIYTFANLLQLLRLRLLDLNLKTAQLCCFSSWQKLGEADFKYIDIQLSSNGVGEKAERDVDHRPDWLRLIT